MPHFVLTDAFFSANGTELSAHVTGGEVEYANTLVEDGPCMGQTARKRKFVISDWRARIRLKQDYAALLVHATLEPLARQGTQFAMIMRPDKSDPISATNPNFDGPVLVESYRAVGGNFGEVAETELVLSAADAITVDITP